MLLHVIALDVMSVLRTQRDKIVARIAAEDAELATAPEDRDEDLTLSQHPADVASDLTARETLLATERTLRGRLLEVDDALERLPAARTASASTAERGSRGSGSPSGRRRDAASRGNATRSGTPRSAAGFG